MIQADLDACLAERGLRTPPSLRAIFERGVAERLHGLVCEPGESAESTIGWAEEIIGASDWPLLPNLVPLLPLDERSFACVVASDVGPNAQPLIGEGAVVRWHLGVKSDEHQAALIDTDCLEFAVSLADELAAREEGLDRVLDIIGPAYQEAYIANEKRPRDFVVRPVRIACQNVVVALAAFAQDSAFDGLSVIAWQTCEVPHVATHEANRALTALTLCEAFKNGGTMEVRFDRPARIEFRGSTHVLDGHPERQVPASLRRFARTVGVNVGASDKAAIAPSEARALFRAVTPMPDALRNRVDIATSREGIAPERLYFALMTGTWHPLELDFMLATTALTGSIVSGGAPWTDRAGRQAESEVCRAAGMAAMLFNRLNNGDAAGSDGVRVLEDNRQGVKWSVTDEAASVSFADLDATQALPWCRHEGSPSLTVFPRTMVTDATVRLVRQAALHGPVGVLVPRDSTAVVPDDMLVLRCPERLADLDKAIEAKLLTSRIARA